MNKTLIALALVGSCLGGCAPTHWSYPGSQREANILSFECGQKAEMSARGTGSWAGLISLATYEDCMRAYGFSKVPNK